MNETLLIQRLKDARRKILISVRPVAPARAAWNLALQGIVDALSLRDETLREQVAALELEETI